MQGREDAGKPDVILTRSCWVVRGRRVAVRSGCVRMVAPTGSDCGSGTVPKRTTSEAAPSDAHTPTRQRQNARCRKQTLMSKLGDSGFEEDLSASPSPSPLRMEVFPLRPSAGQLSTWYLQYGDIGYKIQKEKEAHFHPSRSLARQPQVLLSASPDGTQ